MSVFSGEVQTDVYVWRGHPSDVLREGEGGGEMPQFRKCHDSSQKIKFGMSHVSLSEQVLQLFLPLLQCTLSKAIQ